MPQLSLGSPCHQPFLQRLPGILLRLTHHHCHSHSLVSLQLPLTQAPTNGFDLEFHDAQQEFRHIDSKIMLSYAGVASGLLGIGGGTIVTPLLAIATSMPQAHVVGTSLCAMIPPSIVGLIQHHRLGNVDWRLGLGLAVGTMIGGFGGSNLALTIPDSGLKGVFAVAMFSLCRLTLAKGK